MNGSNISDRIHPLIPPLKQTLMAFLQAGKDYAPAGGEIVGESREFRLLYVLQSAFIFGSDAVDIVHFLW